MNDEPEVWNMINVDQQEVQLSEQVDDPSMVAKIRVKREIKAEHVHHHPPHAQRPRNPNNKPAQKNPRSGHPSNPRNPNHKPAQKNPRSGHPPNPRNPNNKPAQKNPRSGHPPNPRNPNNKPAQKNPRSGHPSNLRPNHEHQRPGADDKKPIQKGPRQGKQAKSLIVLPQIAVINPSFATLETHMKVLATRMLPRKMRPSRCSNCNSFDFNPIILPMAACSGEDPIDLLVLVTTIPKNIVGRHALRNTWMRHSERNTGNVRHVFLFGGGWSAEEQAILYNESSKFDDILQENYKDSYYNLSLKAMSGFKWAHAYCNKAQFALRTADDNYINIPQLVKWIRTNGTENLYAQIGHNSTNLKVLRRKIRKWYITPLEYPEKYYPPYAVGTAFMFSMTALDHIVKIAPDIPYFCIEDAWFGMVLRELNMPVVDEPNFDKQLEDELLDQMMEGKCPDGGNFLSLHLVSPPAMAKLWRQCPSTRPPRLPKIPKQ